MVVTLIGKEKDEEQDARISKVEKDIKDLQAAVEALQSGEGEA